MSHTTTELAPMYKDPLHKHVTYALSHFYQETKTQHRIKFGPQNERRSWQIEMDISAPQILFVEELCDRDASVLVVDFGRLRLANADLPDEEGAAKPQSAEDDEGTSKN